MNDKYIALTIGPIYDTFAQTKRTRAVWAASYFFSWFIKQLTYKTKATGFAVLLPYSKTKQFVEGEKLAYNDVTYQSAYGSGLYADRIYFEPCGKTKKDLQRIVDNIINYVANEIDPKNVATVNSYLRQYLNCHIVEAEISEKSKVLKTLNDLMDQQELKQNFAFDNNRNYLLEYIEPKEILKSFLAEDAFVENIKERKFRSIPEIATTSLRRDGNKIKYDNSLREDFKNEYTELINELKKNDFEILPYNKYYAVLYADGDNVGALLKEISGNFDELREFSKQIFDFGVLAEKAIAKYGGNGIYLGGEDILAFLPAACTEDTSHITQTLFHVIEQLDIYFAQTVGAFADKKGFAPPTLSYGIMLSYLKHPLKESMHEAHDLMDFVAKKKPCKNAVGFRFQKHSGQFMECCIEKSKTCSWGYIKCLIKEYTWQISDKNAAKIKAELLSGVIHRIQDDLFFEIFCAAAREKRLEAFFENFFDEKVHQGTDNPKNIFLQKVRELSEKVFNDYPVNQECRDIIFTVLRFIHFINSTRE
ncbi:MAG: hypothetical protein NT004_16470 [Bacteroidetes bacterium]|nr:hypothetical protein [Bacteroidota bacterium]